MPPPREPVVVTVVELTKWCDKVNVRLSNVGTRIICEEEARCNNINGIHKRIENQDTRRTYKRN